MNGSSKVNEHDGYATMQLVPHYMSAQAMREKQRGLEVRGGLARGGVGRGEAGMGQGRGLGPSLTLLNPNPKEQGREEAGVRGEAGTGQGLGLDPSPTLLNPSGGSEPRGVTTPREASGPLTAHGMHAIQCSHAGEARIPVDHKPHHPPSSRAWAPDGAAPQTRLGEDTTGRAWAPDRAAPQTRLNEDTSERQGCPRDTEVPTHILEKKRNMGFKMARLAEEQLKKRAAQEEAAEAKRSCEMAAARLLRIEQENRDADVAWGQAQEQAEDESQPQAQEEAGAIEAGRGSKETVREPKAHREAEAAGAGSGDAAREAKLGGDSGVAAVEEEGGNKGATPVGISGQDAPEPVVSLCKQGEPQGWSLSDEGCLSTPGLVPNS